MFEAGVMTNLKSKQNHLLCLLQCREEECVRTESHLDIATGLGSETCVIRPQPNNFGEQMIREKLSLGSIIPLTT